MNNAINVGVVVRAISNTRPVFAFVRFHAQFNDQDPFADARHGSGHTCSLPCSPGRFCDPSHAWKIEAFTGLRTLLRSAARREEWDR